MLTVINSSQCPYVTARVLVRAFNYDIASYTCASLLSFPVPVYPPVPGLRQGEPWTVCLLVLLMTYS